MADARAPLWRRIGGDPYTLLLAVAVAVQLTLAMPDQIVRPAWAISGGTAFVVACVLAAIGRARGSIRLAFWAAYLLFVVAGCWRAADQAEVNGYGALVLIAVIWLGFYGTRVDVLLSIAAAALTMVVPQFVVGEQVTQADARRAVLTIALAALLGPMLNSLVAQRRRVSERVSALAPAGSRLDAVLRAASGHLIIGCDPDGTITAFNSGAERILGWSADEVVGRRTLLDFHDPEETVALARRLGVEPRIEPLLQTNLRGAVRVRDYTCRAKDGRRIIVSLSISGVTDDDGELTGYIGIGTDVTEARQALQSLDAQREIYRLLIERLPSTTVALWDQDLRCVTIGGHWVDADSTNSGRYHGRPMEQFFPAADGARVRAALAPARSGPVDVEMDLADGRCFHFAALPVDAPDGQQLVLSLAREITDRRKAEVERQQMVAALSVSEASFREAFENAPIGIAVTTIEESIERFRRVNAAFAAILGRRPEELIGCSVEEVTHPEDRALQADLTVHSPRAGSRVRMRFLRPSGRAVWVEVSYAVVHDADGVPSHIIKQIQDINTIKESERALLDALEQQRAATASLEELDRIRTDLVGTISHELRTPLTSVHGYLELLDAEPLTPSQHGMLEVALRNSERLSALVDNLMVLVRLDAAESMTAFTTTDVVVAAVVETAVDTVRPELTARGQELSVNIGARPVLLRGDAEQLDRVLVNLLSNASKYTPAGGRIAIDLEVGKATAAISVSDTGIGIPVDEHEHLFTRFFRASTARENAINGNGLGLAIVKSIVERHGGTVAVESAPGAGSRFTITLPLARRSAPFVG